MSTLSSKDLSVEQVQKLQRSVAEMGDQHGVVVAAWLIRGMCEEILYVRNGIPPALETGAVTSDTERLDWVAAQSARIEFSDYIAQCITKDGRATTYHHAPVTGSVEVEAKPVALRRSIDALMRRSLKAKVGGDE